MSDYNDYLAQLIRETLAKYPVQLAKKLKDFPLTGPGGVRKVLGGIDLEFFGKAYFLQYHKHKTPQFHKEAYAELDRILNRLPNRARIVRAWPRGNAKSTIFNFFAPTNAALYGKRRMLVQVSDSESQAESFLADIKTALENNDYIQEDFGDVKGAVWRSDMISVKNMAGDVSWVAAVGAGSSIRGLRKAENRPDWICCHERGTQILYGGKWIPVEEHPSFRGFRYYDGVVVRIHGLPFTETVTTDHLYWAKVIEPKSSSNPSVKEHQPCWVKAKDLTKNHYIGYKIDQEVCSPQPILCYAPGGIVDRGSDGRIVKGLGGKFVYEVPKEFHDPEWWWFFGLWWGDGELSYRENDCARTVSVYLANKDKNVLKRIKQLFIKYNINYWIIPRRGCVAVVINNSWISKWLNTWKRGNSMKVPPQWVEKLPLEYQKELIKGYIDADGFVDYKNQCVRLTSIYLSGLLSVRRILMRLGIPSTIRQGQEAGSYVSINGHAYNSKKKYDLRFRDGAKLLGYDIKDQDRYSFTRVHIKDGYLWSKVHVVKECGEIESCPISTADHTYTTHFGVSHNCDDLENDEAVQTPDRVNKLWLWFNRALMNLGDENTDVIVVGTVLADDCVLDRLLKSPTWDSKKLAAIIKWSTSPLWEDWKKIYTDLSMPKEEREARADAFYEEHKDELIEGAVVLWPEGKPYVSLMKIYVDIGETSFHSEQQNEPINFDDCLFKPDWIHYYTQDELDRVRIVGYYGAIDPSLGKTRLSDYTALIVLGKADNGFLYVVDAVVERMNPDRIIQLLLQKGREYEFTRFGIEVNQWQDLLRLMVIEKSARDGTYLPIVELRHSKDKVIRVQALIPYIKNGYIKFNREHRLLIEQLLGFPKLRHDDAPDCLEMAVRMVSHGPAMEPGLTGVVPDKRYVDDDDDADSGYGQRYFYS